MRSAFRARRDVVIFALLVSGGLAGSASLLFFWSDETWGPRYLLAAVAPLLLWIGAAQSSSRFRLRKQIPLLAAAVAGVMISFLGVLFYYGAVHRLALETQNSTLEGLQNDRAWNHIRVTHAAHRERREREVQQHERERNSVAARAQTRGSCPCRSVIIVRSDSRLKSVEWNSRVQGRLAR
jgi:hypothetical protein